jgi:hypothetical protein
VTLKKLTKDMTKLFPSTETPAKNYLPRTRLIERIKDAVDNSYENCATAWGIKLNIERGENPDTIIRELKEAADNCPSYIERILGKSLTETIINF